MDHEQQSWDGECFTWRFLGMDKWQWITIVVMAIGFLVGIATGGWVPCPIGSCFS